MSSPAGQGWALHPNETLFWEDSPKKFGENLGEIRLPVLLGVGVDRGWEEFGPEEGWINRVIEGRAGQWIGSDLGDFGDVLGAAGGEEPPKVRREACSY